MFSGLLGRLFGRRKAPAPARSIPPPPPPASSRPRSAPPPPSPPPPPPPAPTAGPARVRVLLMDGSEAAVDADPDTKERLDYLAGEIMPPPPAP